MIRSMGLSPRWLGQGLVVSLAVLWAAAAPAGYRVAAVVPLPLPGLGGAGQVADPRVSPGGAALGFEFLGAGGETLEVYTAALDESGPALVAAEPLAVMPAAAADPFALGAAAGRRAVSEHLSWGPPKRGRPRFVVAATRRASPRGGAQVNFDLYLSEPGRRRFLTEHPDTDAQPAFHPTGEYLAFSSGRTGQGDIYLYHFFAAADPLVRLSYEAAGSELYPTWDPDGTSIAFVAHLGGDDHLHLVDDVAQVAAAPEERRQALARRVTRDLTPGWRVSCLAPSFSPDGQWLAFYAREGRGDRADLYVVAAAGGAPRLLFRGGLPETRGGPRWAPGGRGLFAVREDADRFNPLFWVPLEEGSPPVVLDTGTELNADPWPVVGAQGASRLLFTAQGDGDANEKRWRQVYQARLEETK